MDNTNISLMKERLFILIEDKNWQKAEEYAEKILDIDPKNVDAYLGKLLIDYKVSTINELEFLKNDFENNNNYLRIQSYGNKNLIDKLSRYNFEIKKRIVATKNKRDNILKSTGKILGAIILVAALSVSGVFLLKDNEKGETQVSDDYKKNWVKLGDLSLRLPNDEKYSVAERNGVAVISGDYSLTINKTLTYIYEENKKRITTCDSFSASNGDREFILRSFCTKKVAYVYGKKNALGQYIYQPETLDLIFCGYGSRYQGFFLNKSGELPFMINEDTNTLGSIHRADRVTIKFAKNKLYTFVGKFTNNESFEFKIMYEGAK